MSARDRAAVWTVLLLGWKCVALLEKEVAVSGGTNVGCLIFEQTSLEHAALGAELWALPGRSAGGLFLYSCSSLRNKALSIMHDHTDKYIF